MKQYDEKIYSVLKLEDLKRIIEDLRDKGDWELAHSLQFSRVDDEIGKFDCKFCRKIFEEHVDHKCWSCIHSGEVCKRVVHETYTVLNYDRACCSPCPHCNIRRKLAL